MSKITKDLNEPLGDTSGTPRMLEVELDEHEVHELVTRWYNMVVPGLGDQPIDLYKVTLVVRPDPENPEPVRIKELKQLEQLMNKVLDGMHEADGMVHDIAEYTC